MATRGAPNVRLDRRAFLAVLACALGAPCAAHAQQGTTRPRLCFLTFDPGTLQSTRFGPFFRGLRDLGYVDGQTLTVDDLSADGRADWLPALAAECLRRNADIIAVTTTPLAQAARSATRTIPIVMLPLGDPVGTGLVDSLGRPGGNVTGVTNMAAGLSAKRLELLKAVVPRASRVLVLAYAVDPIAAPQIEELKKSAPSSGSSCRFAASGPPTTFPPRSTRRPPVQQPTKFEFVINRRTAKALNLTIPPAVLHRGDHVID